MVDSTLPDIFVEISNLRYYNCLLKARCSIDKEEWRKANKSVDKDADTLIVKQNLLCQFVEKIEFKDLF